MESDSGLTIEGCRHSWQTAVGIHEAWSKGKKRPDMILVSPLNSAIFMAKSVEVALEAAFGEAHGIPVVLYDQLRDTALWWAKGSIANKTFGKCRLARQHADIGDVNLQTLGMKQRELYKKVNFDHSYMLDQIWECERGKDLLESWTLLADGVNARTGQGKQTTTPKADE